VQKTPAKNTVQKQKPDKTEQSHWSHTL